MSEAAAAKRILVIDDEADVIEILRALLSTKGHEVITASGGEEGLALAESELPDLIITDLMMPRISGLEVIKQLKKNARLRAIPIVVISALGDEKRPPEFWVKSLGIEDYITKPFDPLDFIGRIEYLFRRSSYVSSQSSEFDGRRRPSTPARDVETQIPLENSDAAPAAVVRTFVESWNRQDFAAEFNCLGEEMLGPLSMREYVSRRRTAFVNDKGIQQRRHEVVSVDEEKISLNIAKVQITRCDTTNGQEKKRQEVYSLKKTNRGWKIVNCRIVKEPTS